MFLRGLVCLFIIAFVTTNAIAQTVDEVLSQWQNHKDFTTASFGVSVINIDDDNELIVNHNGYKTLKPASTLKVVTTATALAILGEDFKFETHLLIEGEITNGVLNGNLIIRGGGDPTLGFMRYDMGLKSREVLSMWAKAITDAGITQINGDIIGDPTFFDSQLVPQKWQWEDMGNYFGAGVAGLNFHENKYEMQFEPAKVVGEKAEVVNIHPPLNGFSINNEVLTGTKNSGDQAVIFCAPYSNAIVVRGTVPAGNPKFTIKGAVSNPALFTANWLKQYLQDRDVIVTGQADFLFSADTSRINNCQIIHQHFSPPLSQIVFWANKKSINIYCEAMLKMIGKKNSGVGSFNKGRKAIVQYWRNRGVDLRKAILQDGSGLSPSNAISPYQMSKLLAKSVKQPWYNTFANSLSVACDKGDRGSMRGMLCNTPAANNLIAKSGYISNNRCYSGYVRNKCGDLMSFTIMVNNYTCGNSQMRKHIEKMMATIARME